MNIQDFNQIPIVNVDPKKQQEHAPSVATESTAKIETKQVSKETEKKKKSSKRCYFHGCRKKLKLTDLECRCENRYCSNHRLPESHECSHSFKDFDRDAFAKQVGLGGGELSKVNKI